MISEVYEIKQLSYVPAQLLEDMLAFIRNNLPITDDADRIIFKAKFVLTELITNAVKHAASDSTELHIDVADKAIHILKTDIGQPLKLHLKETEGSSVVTADLMHTLYARFENNQLHFYCREHDNVLMVDDLPEHFGLLIITKSSDQFYYSFNDSTRLNTFAVTINL